MSSPPNPKKPKLDDIQNPSDSECDISSDDEGFKGMTREEINECFKGMTREEIKEYRRYEKQLRESDGFDVDIVPTAYPRVVGSHLYVCNLNDPKEYGQIEKGTQFVIKKYNELMKGNSRLRLQSISKANRTPINFCITFDAEDTVSGCYDTYQTLTCQYSFDGSIELLFIRKKCDKKEICFPVDLDDQEEFARLNKCAALTVSEYNEEKEGKLELEFVKLVKALQNMKTYCLLYWITFEAKDTKSDQINTYSAQILYDPKYDGINILNRPELEEHRT